MARTSRLKSNDVIRKNYYYRIAGLIFLISTAAINGVAETRQNLFPGAVGVLNVVHIAAVAYGDSDVTLSGTQTIDGVVLVVNNRVLLNNQTDPTKNGLWLVQSGAWTRPFDFVSGGIAGVAYLLITGGNNYNSTSWVCVMPSAIIDIDNILFAQSATYNRTTGANVGAGFGEIFRNKTGNIINFRTITGDAYLTAATVDDVVTLTTDATASNTPSTIVARDSSGDFSAHNLTTNMVTLAGAVADPTDATTKAYVDSAIVGGTLVGDVTGTIGNNTVSYVGGLSGVTQAQIISGVNAANLATNAATGNRIVLRDGSGNFSAGTISANLTGTVTGSLVGNASTATSATTATNFTGSLIGDVTGTQAATVVNAVGGQTATNVANATITVAAATNLNTAGTLVQRDGSGNFSAGTITAALTGTVTGSLVGNASTATSATTATTATNFSGSLSGNVSGPQSATVVDTVGGQTASAVAIAATSVAAATPNNTASVLVLRDAAKNFATNMVTLNGTVANPTDATTKAYVDAAVSSGFTVHPAALVYSASSITLSGLQTIDGVSLSADNRVLLNGQSTTSQNGLWLAQSSTWTRPTDFSAGTTAGSAYVLIQSGTTYAGTGWVCSTPSATIDATATTDPISFSQFSTTGQTTATNVGTGAGQIFRDKTGNTLNLKTVAAGTHITVTDNSNDITLATDGVSTNTASTLVARDGSGNFSAGTITAALTGAASLNVLKTGDTMSGNLNLAAQSATRWQDLSDSNYVGLRAPSAGVGTSYTLDLPGSAPAVNQFLQAATTSTLGWTDIGGTPALSKIFYVTKNGNDTTGNGAFSAPYLTIAKAVSVANLLTSTTNPITISIGSGVFIEDNSGGAITISNDGLSLVGSSILGTVIQPNTFSNDLFNCTTPNVEFRDLTLDASAGTSTANAIVVNSNRAGIGRFQSIAVQQFQTAFNLSSTVGVPILRFNNVQPRANGTAFIVTNIHVVLQSSIILGPISNLSTPAFTGMNISGSSSLVEIFGTLFRALDIGIAVANGASLYQTSNNFELNNHSIVATGGCNATATGCNFLYCNTTSAAGSGTILNIASCDFMCSDTNNINRGIAVQVTTGGTANVSNSTINNALIGLQCGTLGDTSSTVLQASSGVTLNGCTKDINQVGTSTLHFIGGTFDVSKTSFGDKTNVSLVGFDFNGDNFLSVGNMVDGERTIYQILNGQTVLPTLVYEPNYYGSKGTVYKDGTSDPTFNGTLAAGNNASYYVITGDNTKTAGLNLISDTANIGTSDNVRGWNINKASTTAGLGFTYFNNDTSGQAARGANAVMNLNGFDNQVEFPTAANTPLPTNTVAKLVWAGDTNLYRSASNQLKTDGFVIVGGLTASRAIATDGSDQLVSSATTATELGYVSGTTSAIQTQLNSKLSSSGGTLTGPLTTQDLIVAATYILCNQSMVRVTPTTGTTVVIANTTSILLIQPASNLNALTLQFPNTGLTNGQILTISCTANINTITYTNATVNSAATAFTNTLRNAAYIYNLAQNQWYRIA